MRKNNPFELEQVSVRLVKDAPIYSDTEINSPEAAVKLMGTIMCELDRESICIINLKTDGTPINCNIASIGIINQAICNPRELLKASILSNAAAVIMLHNHPSGKIDPSKDDVMITDRVMQIYEQVGISFQDHVIVGIDSDRYFSFREKEILPAAKLTYESDYHRLNFQKDKAILRKEDIEYLESIAKKLLEKENPQYTEKQFQEYIKQLKDDMIRTGYYSTIGQLKDKLQKKESPSQEETEIVKREKSR